MNILVVFGTRPEVIKLWRVIEELKKVGAKVDVLDTQQHETRGLQLELGITVHHQCGFAARSAESLAEALGRLIERTSWCMRAMKYDLVVVQGDTMSALAGALAAFYNQIPVAHVEAGLRTYDLTSPFPEEGNRQMISRIASLHFCPTEENLTNLVDENVYLGETVHFNALAQKGDAYTAEFGHVTGNSGLDALGMVAKAGDPSGRDVLVTFHRREAWDRVEELAGSIRKIAQQGHHVEWITHGNPQLRARVRDAAGSFNASSEPCDNNDGPCQCGAWHHPTDGIVLLREPQPYKDFIRMLANTKVVITDSGGVVEECVSLGRRCIMVRDQTERSEALEHGHRLVSLDEIDSLPGLVESALRNWTTAPSNVFGDGLASQRIARHIVDFLKARHGQ